MNISYFDLVVVIGYVIAVVIYGIWKSRKVKNSQDFLVAGRSLGLFVLVATVVMTEFNSATMVGYSSFGYQAGTYSLLILLSMLIGFIAYTFIVAKRWKRINATSIVELFEIRYDKHFRLLVTFMTIILLLFFSPAYLRAIGLIFASCLGIPLPVTVIIISLTVLIFSVAGGLTAVAHTNKFSFVITLIALPLLLFFTKSNAELIGNLEQFFPEKYLTMNPKGMWNDQVMPFSLILATYALMFFIYMQSPWYAQLMTAAKNEKTAYLSMGIGTVLIVVLYGIAIRTASYVKIGFPNLSDPQLALSMAINHWLPVGVTGLVLAVILAIGQTTMATIWNNIVAISTNDIYKRIFKPKATEKKILRFSRICTICVAIFTIIVSVTIVDQVINVLFIGNIILASLFFPTLGGFLWWRTGEKASWFTTIATIVIGFSSILFFRQYGIFDINRWMFAFYLIVCPTIVVLGIIFSLFEKPTKKYLLKKIDFFKIVGPPVFQKNAFLKSLEEENLMAN